MSTKFADMFSALAAPFDASEVKVRAQGGRQLHYVTARTVMNRLDNVLGPENWWAEYSPFVEHSVRCRLTLRLPDGSTVTKEGIGGFADMADAGDGDKSGASDAIKRAGVEVGIARYLYRDGVPAFAGHAAPPAEPAQARRDEPRQERREAPAAAHNGSGNGHAQGNGNGRQGGQYSGPPKTGKALFAWCKDKEQEYEVGLLKYISNWAKLQDFPGRMVEFDAEQVKLAYDEACRKLQAVEAQGNIEAHADAAGGY